MRTLREVEGFRQMAAKMAWRAWLAIPMQTRTWIGVEDMLQEAMMHLYLSMPRYDGEWASLSTFFYHQLHQFYYTHYVERYRILRKRNEAGVISLQGMQSMLGDGASLDDVAAKWGYYQLAVSAEPVVHNVVTECFVVPSLGEVFKQGSPRLKSEMVHWFLRSRMKVHVGSKKFEKAAKEFRRLSLVHDLQKDDCLHLMKSAKCIDLLSRQLLLIPYDLDNPCPQVDRQL